MRGQRVCSLAAGCNSAAVRNLDFVSIMCSPDGYKLITEKTHQLQAVAQTSW